LTDAKITESDLHLFGGRILVAAAPAGWHGHAHSLRIKPARLGAMFCVGPP